MKKVYKVLLIIVNSINPLMQTLALLEAVTMLTSLHSTCFTYVAQAFG